MTPIKIHLDTGVKTRGKSEWRDVNRALLTWVDSYKDEEVGDHSIITSLLRRFHEKHPSINARVEVLRGGCPMLRDSGNKSVAISTQEATASWAEKGG